MAKNPVNISGLISKMITALKSTPADKVQDLADIFDDGHLVASDQWNAADHGNRSRTATGPAEAMSSSGAETMVDRYSKFTAQMDALMQGYAAMGEELKMATKAVKAITGFLGGAFGKGAPDMWSDDDEPAGKETNDRVKKDPDPDDDKDKDEASKSVRVQNLGTVPEFFRALSNASRTGGSSLATPPDLSGHVTMKGGSPRERVMEAISKANFAEPDAGLRAGELLSAYTVASATDNDAARERFRCGWAAAPASVRAVFEQSGIGFTMTSAVSKANF